MWHVKLQVKDEEDEPEGTKNGHGEDLKPSTSARSHFNPAMCLIFCKLDTEST